jgi:alpha,alpha-trehalose phosphorylase
MLRHIPVEVPEAIYPVDDWRLVQNKFQKRYLADNESFFALSNGYLGIRGGFEEGRPTFLHGTYLNGFYESWTIPYGESAYGYATTGQTIVNVPDGKIIRLYVDDEPFHIQTPYITRFERALDMEAGTLDREVLWETPSGKQVLIRSRRLVSLEHRHLAAICYEVTLLNANAPLVLASELVRHAQDQVADHRDPRNEPTLKGKVLVPRGHAIDGHRILQSYQTISSKMNLACGMDHVLETDCRWKAEVSCEEELGRVLFSVDGEAGKRCRLVKYLAYHTSRGVAPPEELRARSNWTLDRARTLGFEQLLEGQRRNLEGFWQRSDVQVQGTGKRGQQYVHFNLFHVYQACARAEGTGVPAKGLTGQAYEGHFFWDMEVYLLPFLIYTSPWLARNLLAFRYSILDKARSRAREVNQKGALFPWRTINGDEASANYASGTAQYHINADIMYALKKYVEVTGDETFLLEYGAEMLVETARLWHDLGFFNKRRKEQFCIHGVTGPDEYTTVVDNNTFTNLMAQENLRYAAEVLEWVQADHPDHFQVLVHRTGFDPGEAKEWQRAADHMYIPFDERLGIHPQDDSFLDKEEWHLQATPRDKFPLLLYYHPLVIYRHQVLKQADVVLAMFLLGQKFSLEQKRHNFDYYDPRTTGDSSLSACIQSIVAAEVGNMDKALAYLRYAALMDLADIGGNVKDGCHIASMGGTWMALVYGLAGLRDHEGQLSFNPSPPREAGHLCFPLTVRGQVLHVDMTRDSVVYHLVQGEGLTITHWGENIHLVQGQPITRPVSE